jgi:hypothetical protein
MESMTDAIVFGTYMISGLVSSYWKIICDVQLIILICCTTLVGPELHVRSV